MDALIIANLNILNDAKYKKNHINFAFRIERNIYFKFFTKTKPCELAISRFYKMQRTEILIFDWQDIETLLFANFHILLVCRIL